MQITYFKIIETLIIIGIYFFIKIASNRLINRTTTHKLIQKSRAKIIKQAFNILLLFISISIILIIWGVKQSDLAAYIGSILTVVGVAFFAQWSILSNITSSVIIFFNHSVKINDKIIIMEAKDYEIEGKIKNIGLFFVTIKTTEGNEISLPNNIFIQKMIKK